MDYLQSVAAARARCDAVLASKAVDEPQPTNVEKTKNALSEAPSAVSVRAVFPRAPKVKVIAELPDKDASTALEECQDLLGDGKVEVVVEDLSGRRFDEVPVLALPNMFVEAGGYCSGRDLAAGQPGAWRAPVPPRSELLIDHCRSRTSFLWRGRVRKWPSSGRNI